MGSLWYGTKFSEVVNREIYGHEIKQKISPNSLRPTVIEQNQQKGTNKKKKG